MSVRRSARRVPPRVDADALPRLDDGLYLVAVGAVHLRGRIERRACGARVTRARVEVVDERRVPDLAHLLAAELLRHANRGEARNAREVMRLEERALRQLADVAEARVLEV